MKPIRAFALLAAAPLALGATVAAPALAHADTVFYNCSSVSFLATVHEVFGHQCTGPATAASAIVGDDTSGATYSCTDLVLSDFGTLNVLTGKNCVPR